MCAGKLAKYGKRLFQRPTDESVGWIKWEGPGPLTISPGSSIFALCKVATNRSWKQDLLVVEALIQHPLLAGIVISPCVLLPSEMNGFSVLFTNESQRARSIPKGTVVAHVSKADLVTTIEEEEQLTRTLDPWLFDFWDSPIPPLWKKSLAKKLAEIADVFSLGEWEVGLAKDIEHNIRLSDT